MNHPSIAFLGTRGSIAVEGPDYLDFGGAGICVLLSMAGEHILLDGGTGLHRLPDYLPAACSEVHLLLSHPHIDHLAGIPLCPSFFSGPRLCLYAVPHEGRGAKAQLDAFMSPPLWPVTSDIFSPPCRFVDIAGDFTIGPVQVSTLEVPHPGGCTAYRLRYENKTLVYATDCELDAESACALADFARDCSLLLCDGQYSDDELAAARGFGHSSWMQAGALAKLANAKQLGIIHHDPRRSDAQLHEAQAALQALMPNSFFARKGVRIDL